MVLEHPHKVTILPSKVSTFYTVNIVGGVNVKSCHLL